MRKIIMLGLAAGAAMLCNAANAATATTTFQVKLTIQSQCTIVSVSALDFGTNGVINANIDQGNTLNVQCTNTTPYNIGLNAGANGGTIATRLMKGGPSNETIAYSLYSNPARTTVWGETIGTDTVTGTGNGASQPYPIYGRVPAQTTPAPGNYTDTITVTVTY
jgi:spore coat protein U-like protein